MTRGIGWYVHHQGAGHCQRARAVAAALPRPCTLIGSLAGFDTGGLDVLDLPDDRPLGEASGFDGRDGAADRPDALHYAPLNHPGVRARMAAIAAWAARTDPALIVVDVSVEVALLARLLSVPTIVVRLAGTRTDAPHLEAFRSAARLLAPFPEALEGAGVPASGVSGGLRVHGLLAVWLYALRAWEQDDSPDLSSTMAAVDRGLDRAMQAEQSMPGRRPDLPEMPVEPEPAPMIGDFPEPPAIVA